MVPNSNEQLQCQYCDLVSKIWGDRVYRLVPPVLSPSRWLSKVSSTHSDSPAFTNIVDLFVVEWD